MEPRLVAIAGPLKGTTIMLGDPETIIGRDPANRIATNDALVSRRHCAIRDSGAEMHLADLDSLNGTFVNGKPTREQKLEHGDHIKVGGSQFIFLYHDDDVKIDIPLTDSFEGQLITALTVKLDRKNSLLLHPENFADAFPPNMRLPRDLA